jgi:hypothetical protein
MVQSDISAMTKRSEEQYSAKETAQRFNSILRGAMHKPTPLKDIPKKRIAKTPKSSSRSSRASG